MEGTGFQKLVRLMDRLRAPDGCPWDREQDLKTLQPMLIEEVYEVVEAVDAEDYDGLREELGDLLLHVVFHARLGQEAGRFTIDDVVEGICEKLIRRHPHVFGDRQVADAEAALDRWEELKAAERAEAGSEARHRLLEGIPPRLPALHEAHKISSRAARAGFDWPEIEGVFEKLAEEVDELREAIAQTPEPPGGGVDPVEEEIGDLLFVVVNLARFLGVDSESALKRANRKFRHRFRFMEDRLEGEGRKLEEATPAEMEAIWADAKQAGKDAGGPADDAD